jgi:hypothetical protein
MNTENLQLIVASRLGWFFDAANQPRSLLDEIGRE